MGENNVMRISSSPSAKLIDDAISSKNPQSSVTCVYQTHIGGHWRSVTVVWNKNVMNHSVTLTVDSIEEVEEGGNDHHPTCKIDLKPWNFWAKKGYKTFEVDGNHLEAYWDLRSPKFSGSGSPEPCSDYYVALVAEEEVVLLLGDHKKKAYKRSKARPALVDAVHFYKKEHVFGKKSFSTRARLDNKMNKECEIVVELSSTTAGGSSFSSSSSSSNYNNNGFNKDPEMWISIEGIVLVHVKSLQWKFRGNQTVVVNKLPVQVYWDVHDWLFCSSSSSSSSLPGGGWEHGLFIFKPEGTTGETTTSDAEESGSAGGDSSECGSTESRYYSTTQSHSGGGGSTPFCLFLYAWKLE
ncbi:hypothetical protein DM860_014401 [Cuscuta australis]|uniref:DUF868 domain-containing protein n=1 Tax=Cuscuta australis TaxID=267555 RepID=A0A328DF59_9ASTE|nr:hypothetical protein DM860_014401 [Cuscuta australis]